jgi:hypothetical protein
MTHESDSSAGDGMQIDPDLLTAQGDRFAKLGDELCRHAATHPVQSPQLGTSPPAVKFAQQLAALTGDTGAAALITAWGAGLISMGVNQRAAATTYTAADTGSVDILRRIGPDN